MNAFEKLRARAVRMVQSRASGAAPESALPAEPLAGRLGPAAFLPGGVPGGSESFGEQSRDAHRHGWFARLAARHAAGDPGAGELAVEGLQSWLRHDRPGVGVAWAHPTDLAVRLVHQAAGFAWLGAAAPAELQALAAGSAAWHLRHLRVRLPLAAGDEHRRVAHHVGALVGGLTFPAIPEAREAWSEAASLLGPAVDELTFGDGSDRSGAPAFLAQSLWLVAIAYAVARANGVALPTLALSSWSRGVRFLDRIANDNGSIPPLGEAPFGQILELPGVPLAASLRVLAVRWGLDAPEPVTGDPRSRWFVRDERPEPRGGVSGPKPAATGAAAARTWTSWTFAEDGLAVAVMPVRNEALRVILAANTRSGGSLAHRAPLQLLVDVGASPLLADPGPGRPAREEHDGLVVRGLAPGESRLTIARVDGKKARLEGSASLGGGARWAREVLLNQQRVRVTDRLEGTGATVALRWTIGPSWAIEGAEGRYILRSGPHTVAVELPSALSWRLEPGPNPALVGAGALAAGAELLCSFEVR